jgi:hypothetical protein
MSIFVPRCRPLDSTTPRRRRQRETEPARPTVKKGAPKKGGDGEVLRPDFHLRLHWVQLPTSPTCSKRITPSHSFQSQTGARDPWNPSNQPCNDFEHTSIPL